MKLAASFSLALLLSACDVAPPAVMTSGEVVLQPIGLEFAPTAFAVVDEEAGTCRALFLSSWPGAWGQGSGSDGTTWNQRVTAGGPDHSYDSTLWFEVTATRRGSGAWKFELDGERFVPDGRSVYVQSLDGSFDRHELDLSGVTVESCELEAIDDGVEASLEQLVFDAWGAIGHWSLEWGRKWTSLEAFRDRERAAAAGEPSLAVEVGPRVVEPIVFDESMRELRVEFRGDDSLEWNEVGVRTGGVNRGDLVTFQIPTNHAGWSITDHPPIGASDEVFARAIWFLDVDGARVECDLTVLARRGERIWVLSRGKPLDVGRGETWRLSKHGRFFPVTRE
ncbi:MAG: hypothetical protein R3F34_03525 [Planctomycetota bacterium]